MTFPETPLPIKNELLIDGTWVDVTTRTRNSADVTIQRGLRGEQSSIGAATCGFTLNNRDGWLSGRNPMSPYYGLIGRNTPFRNSVTEDTVSLRLADNSDLATGAYDGARAETADKAVLDVTGDIDIRIDIEPDNWRTRGRQLLASKYVTTGDQRSWTVYLTATGLVTLIWSTDGTSGNRVFATSDDTVATLGRQAIRVTVDVNNGSGGKTVTFYTSDTIGGSWTQLGSAVTTSGTSSIHGGTAALEIGTINGGSDRYAVISGAVPFTGKIYGFELRNGIGGTLVADFDPTGRTPGDTSWSDGLGTPNTWTLQASAEVTNADYRFHGEVSKLPQRWDSTGTDVFVPTTASDVWQRLGQGEKPLKSALYNHFAPISVNDDLSGWWSMEAGEATTVIPAEYGAQGRLTDGTFVGSPSDFPGTAGALQFTSDNGYASAVVDANQESSTGTAYFMFYFKLPSIPGGTIGPIVNFYLGGTSGSTGAYRVDIGASATSYQLAVKAVDGSTLLSTSVAFGSGGEPDQWIAMRVLLTQDGGNIDYEWGWYPIGGAVLFGVSGTFAGTLGWPRSWISFPYTGKNGLQVAHIVMTRTELAFNDTEFLAATNAFDGETVAARFARLCRAKRLRYWIVGALFDVDGNTLTRRMGPQRVQKFTDLVKECVDLDGGLLYTPRDKLGLTLHLRDTMLSRTPVELDYSAKHLSEELQPDEDDSLTRNDVTVSRPDGGSARSVQTSGPLNVNDPADDPQGAGLYDVGLTRVAELDSDLPGLAQYEKFLGTWDELRYRAVTVNLAREPFLADAALTAAVRALDLGDPVRIANLPAWLPPDPVELLNIGYTEVQRNREQVVTWSSRPYGPFKINDLTESDDSLFRAAATNSSLVSALNSTDTTFQVKTPAGALWTTDAGNLPLDIVIGGERMTVGSISGSSSPQTFSSVTRSVNSIEKSHSADDVVDVAESFTATL